MLSIILWEWSFGWKWNSIKSQQEWKENEPDNMRFTGIWLGSSLSDSFPVRKRISALLFHRDLTSKSLLTTVRRKMGERSLSSHPFSGAWDPHHSIATNSIVWPGIWHLCEYLECKTFLSVVPYLWCQDAHLGNHKNQLMPQLLPLHSEFLFSWRNA